MHVDYSHVYSGLKSRNLFKSSVFYFNEIFYISAVSPIIFTVSMKSTPSLLPYFMM